MYLCKYIIQLICSADKLLTNFNHDEFGNLSVYSCFIQRRLSRFILSSPCLLSFSQLTFRKLLKQLKWFRFPSTEHTNRISLRMIHDSKFQKPSNSSLRSNTILSSAFILYIWPWPLFAYVHTGKLVNAKYGVNESLFTIR